MVRRSSCLAGVFFWQEWLDTKPCGRRSRTAREVFLESLALKVEAFPVDLRQETVRLSDCFFQTVLSVPVVQLSAVHCAVHMQSTYDIDDDVLNFGSRKSAHRHPVTSTHVSDEILRVKS